MIRIITIAFLLCLTFQSAISQLNVGVDIRPRAEFRNGFKSLLGTDQDPAFFIEQRSRLRINYGAEKFSVKLSLQDVRIWGSTPQINKTDGYFSVHEAYGEYRFNTKWAIRTGRQEISYDNQRLLGALDWAAQGRSHDAIKLTYDSEKKLSIHLAAAYNQEGNHSAFNNAEGGKLSGTYYSINNYKALTLLHASKSFSEGKISFYVINNGMQRDTSQVYFTHTFGPYFTVSAGDINLEGSFFYQTGKDDEDINTNAYLAALAATYGVVQVGVDVLSGNRPGNDGKRTSFDPLYGTHHAFYGFMDYFHVGNPHSQPGVGTTGLVDIFAKLKVPVSSSSTFHTHYHYFRSPVQLLRNGEDLNRTLGHEIDLMLTSKLAPEVNLTLGYSQMFATEAMEFIKGGNKDRLNNWAFVMLSFSPTIFSNQEQP